MPELIRDLMTVRVVSVRFDEPISAAVDRFVRFGFSALPVVSGSSRLVGMVSLLDVLRYREAHEADGLQADERVAVEEIMTADVVWLSATANVGVVAQRLRSNGELRVMPIVQGGRLVGVVTRSDLLRRSGKGSNKGSNKGSGKGAGMRAGMRAGLLRFLGGRGGAEAGDDALMALARGRRGRVAAPAATPVRDVMTRQTITVRSAEPVALAAELMLHHRHTSLPVVDGNSRLVGIVSEADILAAPQAGRVATATVGRVMTTTPITVDVGTTVGEARALVAHSGLRTVPVTEGDRLVGVLSRSDLV